MMYPTTKQIGPNAFVIDGQPPTMFLDLARALPGGSPKIDEDDHERKTGRRIDPFGRNNGLLDARRSKEPPDNCCTF